jgi:BsuBI/PstI restriction endonuclease domain
LFAGSSAGLVYVTAFPNRAIMSRYLGEIAWETEVWVVDAPSHLIHFNGERFLGPHTPAISYTFSCVPQMVPFETTTVDPYRTFGGRSPQ